MTSVSENLGFSATYVSVPSAQPPKPQSNCPGHYIRVSVSGVCAGEQMDAMQAVCQSQLYTLNPTWRIMGLSK